MLKYISICLFLFQCLSCSMPLSPPKSKINPISKEQIQEELTKIKTSIQTRPDWLFPIDICPADVLPDKENMSDYGEENCQLDPSRCYERCENGKGSACYGLAVAMQDNLGIDQEESEALHLRACKLGYVSGCTNRAASKYNLEENNPDSVQCAVKTFEKTCEKDDPWGCTMLGFALAHGKGIERDFDKALIVLSKSCKYGEEDEACKNANDLKKQIRDLKNTSKTNKINKSHKR